MKFFFFKELKICGVDALLMISIYCIHMNMTNVALNIKIKICEVHQMNICANSDKKKVRHGLLHVSPTPAYVLFRFPFTVQKHAY